MSTEVACRDIPNRLAWAKLLRFLFRPYIRIATVGLLLAAALFTAYTLWSPGTKITDGRHDLNRNGIWLQHGWLADDAWLKRNDKNFDDFRSVKALQQLRAKLDALHIRDVFPHMCPARFTGHLPGHDPQQIEAFLDTLDGYRVSPWIGGVHEDSANPASPKWRATFCQQIADLIAQHPRLAGVHLNIEPMPSGNEDYITLLNEIRAALPQGKILSIAAYPPPTVFQPGLEVHWEEAYWRRIAAICDQMVPMLYDTSIRWRKPYQAVLHDWTVETLSWAESTEVLLGLPAYADAGVGYHHPEVENLGVALPAIHAGLQHFDALPQNYAGVAIYAEWTLTEDDKGTLVRAFLRNPRRPAP